MMGVCSCFIGLCCVYNIDNFIYGVYGCGSLSGLGVRFGVGVVVCFEFLNG